MNGFPRRPSAARRGVAAVSACPPRRRGSAEALRLSEERYRTLVDNLTDFVWEVDADGRYTYVSARVRDILGYAPAELIGRAPFDLMPPDEAWRIADEFAALAEAREPIQRLENINVTKDGRMVVLETSGAPILDADGALLGYRGVDRDVTERRSAEEALRWEADVRGVFAELGRLLLAPISIEQLSRTVVERGCRLLGALRGCACHQDPEDGGKVRATPVDFDYAVLCGEVVGEREAPDSPWLSVPVAVDGRPVGSLTFADAGRPCEPRDIEVAERLAVMYGLALRRAWDEKALRDSRARLETVTAAARDGIVMVDEHGRISFWNAAAERIFGWSEAEALGRPLDDMLAGDGEVEGRRKDGSTVPVEVTMVATRLGQRATTVATVKDLTERKQAERLRLEMETRLFQARKMDALGTLAGGIAHNFNNMLMPVMVLTELTIRELAPDAPGRKRLEAVLQASQRARDLIQRILAFGRHDAAAMRPVDLRDIVAEGLELLRSTLPRGIELRERLDALPGPVMADRGQLLTVLMNLCGNAADAMEGATGVLEVALAVDRAVDALPPGAYARLTVSDTGHGMDDDTLRRVFEPFFTTKGVGSGTGLGLATAQAIITAHGGTILVRSAPGEGTVFDIYLPLAEVGGEAAFTIPYPNAR